MKAHNNHQIIEYQGQPVAVVIPYDEYQKLFKKEQNYTVPHEVVEHRVVNGYSSIKAWRLYRGFTQKAMAEQMSITQPAYNQLEKRPFYKAREETQRKLCEVLAVEPAMMTDFEDIEL